MDKTIGIVIVSHSALVAEGTAVMAEQMTGGVIPIAWCGGNIGGGLGSDAGEIQKAIESAWSDDGVAIFVDLGSTELNSQIAIERLSSGRQEKVKLMDAPLVEGVIVASAAASSGQSLDDINQTLTTLCRRN